MDLAMDFTANTPPMLASDNGSDHDISVFTPPLHGSFDEWYASDDDSDYFAKPYVPLSNLPTPPPAKHSEDTFKNRKAEVELSNSAEAALLGPAIHLCNLIPTSASLLEPDVRLVHKMLADSFLPPETMALACCILDSLNSRFALLWRRTLPREDSRRVEPVHIDSIRPEVIILAALVIAVKFLDDMQYPLSLCAEFWGRGRWSCDQIVISEHCINENLGYKIHPLWQDELIRDALKDMKNAGVNAQTNVKIPDENMPPAEWLNG